jgi:hypothetical protein
MTSKQLLESKYGILPELSDSKDFPLPYHVSYFMFS